MARHVLDEQQLHPAIRDTVSNHHRDVVEEVREAIDTHAVVVVGMKQNPHPRKACQLLKKEGIDYTYLEYGSYVGPWRRRNALKMWTGWPTFPMVFVRGVLIGGRSNLAELIRSGELPQMLDAKGSTTTPPSPDPEV